MAKAWLGIDLGTSAVKAVLVDPGGGLLASGQGALALATPEPLAAEQSAEAWWAATQRALAACLEAAGPVDVMGVGLTGQKHALLLLDADRVPLGPAWLWADGRARQACLDLAAIEDRLAQRTGAPALPGYVLPKWLLWQSRHPERLPRVAHLLFAKDWLRLRLTGELATDPTEAGASQLWHAPSGRWVDSRCRAVGIDPAWLPRVAPSNAETGRVTAEAGRQTGLPPDNPVVSGAGDNEAAALACGAVRPGLVAVILGTSGTVIAPASRRGRVGGLVWGPHVLRRGVAATGTMLAAGRALDWARETFLPPGTGAAEALEQAFAVGDAEALPVFLPSLGGERSPVPDPEARGAFVDLAPEHGPRHLVRAVADGVSATLGEIVQLLRTSGVEVEELRLTSGGAASGPWRSQVLAAADCPGRVVGGRAGPARGAALLAARMGARDAVLAEAAATWFVPGPREAPDPALVARMAGIRTRLASIRGVL